MSVKKLGPKNWEACVYWREPDGKKRSRYKRGFTSKAAAQQWEQEQIEASQGISHAPATKQITMNQLHNEYLARLERLERSPKTVEFYQGMANSRHLPAHRTAYCG